MRAAATRLTEGSLTIQEVAAAVGYAHLADFDHHCKAHFGTTPSSYRAQLNMSGAATIPATSDPLRPPAPRSAWTSSIEHKPLVLDASGKAHVLIVEDDRTGTAFAQIFADAGYEVATLKGHRTVPAAAGRWQRRVVGSRRLRRAIRQVDQGRMSRSHHPNR